MCYSLHSLVTSEHSCSCKGHMGQHSLSMAIGHKEYLLHLSFKKIHPWLNLLDSISDKTRCQIFFYYEWVWLRGLWLNYSLGGFDSQLAETVWKCGMRLQWVTWEDMKKTLCCLRLCQHCWWPWLCMTEEYVLAWNTCCLLRSEEEIFVIITFVFFFIIKAYNC